MDPVANKTQQERGATALIEALNAWEELSPHSLNGLGLGLRRDLLEAIVVGSRELAQYVLEYREWRAKGGFPA